MIDRVKERAAAQLSDQKDKATDGLGSVAHMVRQGTQQLRDQQHETLAGYVERAADQIDRLSQQLRDKDVGELVENAQNMARRRPAVFIGSAFALGVIGARFFKSSSTDDQYERSTSFRRSGSYRPPSGNVYGSSETAGSYTSTSRSNISPTTPPPASGTGIGGSATPIGTAADDTSTSSPGTSASRSRRGSGGTTGRS